MAVMIEEERTLGEPVDLRGIPDDTRTGKLGLVSLAREAGRSLKGSRIRQLVEMGEEWRQRTAEALGVTEEELLGLLLAGDPSVVDHTGALTGVALVINEAIFRIRPGGPKSKETRSRPQRFPLLGELISRGWVFDMRFIRMFFAQGFNEKGNPDFQAIPIVLDLLSQHGHALVEEIEQALDIKAGASGPLLDRMEHRQGLIERSTNRVALTAAGWDLVRRTRSQQPKGPPEEEGGD